MLGYKLRRGRSADGRVVRDIFFAALREHGFAAIKANLNPEVANFGVTDPSRDDFVAVSSGKVVGFIILLPAQRGDGELSKVFVARSHRGRGVGTMLIARAVETAKTRGYAGLHLTTNPAFATACAYYERHDWERQRADDAEALTYVLRLCEAPRPLPAVPPLLRRVLDLLDTAKHLRARLESDLGARRSASSGRPRLKLPPAGK